MKLSAFAKHIPCNHSRCNGAAKCCGNGTSGNPHLHREYEQPVQKYVQKARYNTYGGSILGRSVQPDDKCTDGLNENENATRKQWNQVLKRQRQEHIATSQQVEKSIAKEIENDGNQGHQKRRHFQRLRNIDIGRFVVTLCQMNTCHHRYAHAEHQRNAGCYQKQRSHDIDSRQGITSHSLPDENPVRHRQKGRKYH